ncbi:hypothetical protein NE237_000167 [Protea cynaroides]|uniref:F-box domain-containing protein n=1 Tax=Protea cynaroides TaxID=273540 RepID=A0A9Q0GNZ8_9MAGN|nr:hypothetical protein NE237_000167 [Protea cynaroides]
MEQEGTNVLYVLPEGFIAEILSRTSPRDACRSSVVSSIFRSTADSDSVWERFLPSDIQLILSSSVSPFLPNFSSKKEQFLHLCDNPLLIDNGTKTLALEKCNGKKCYMIGAKELSIAWGDTPMYWNWPSRPESRFSEVAELLEVCWLEIRGKMETRFLSTNTTYVAYLVFKFKYDASGFDYEPIEVSVKLASGGRPKHGEVKSVYSKRPEETEAEGEVPVKRKADSRSEAEVPKETKTDSVPEREAPKERGDGWMELGMGEFFNERGVDGVVEMSLKEIKVLWCISGLIIEGIELRPKENL